MVGNFFSLSQYKEAWEFEPSFYTSQLRLIFRWRKKKQLRVLEGCGFDLDVFVFRFYFSISWSERGSWCVTWYLCFEFAQTSWTDRNWYVFLFLECGGESLIRTKEIALILRRIIPIQITYNFQKILNDIHARCGSKRLWIMYKLTFSGKLLRCGIRKGCSTNSGSGKSSSSSRGSKELLLLRNAKE